MKKLILMVVALMGITVVSAQNVMDVAKEANTALEGKNYVKAAELLEKVIADGSLEEDDAILEQVNSAKKNLPIAYFYTGRLAAAAATKKPRAKKEEAVKIENQPA